MELGKGRSVDEADLEGLRDRMFEHMESYDRIFALRCLHPRDGPQHDYELVEIPKSYFLKREISRASCSSQTPKPGDCTVTDDGGNLRFQLYFDGGTERKLQIRSLAKSECRVHAHSDLSRAEPPRMSPGLTDSSLRTAISA